MKTWAAACVALSNCTRGLCSHARGRGPCRGWVAAHKRLRGVRHPHRASYHVIPMCAVYTCAARLRARVCMRAGCHGFHTLPPTKHMELQQQQPLQGAAYSFSWSKEQEDQWADNLSIDAPTQHALSSTFKHMREHSNTHIRARTRTRIFAQPHPHPHPQKRNGGLCTHAQPRTSTPSRTHLGDELAAGSAGIPVPAGPMRPGPSPPMPSSSSSDW